MSFLFSFNKEVSSPNSTEGLFSINIDGFGVELIIHSIGVVLGGGFLDELEEF